MASPAVGAKALLVAASVGSNVPSEDWSVHISKMPAIPDRAIAIFDSGGVENPNPKWLLDYKSIQVRVRGNVSDYTAVYQKITDVQDVLLGLTAQTVAGDRWDGVTGISDITFLGRDDNDRPELIANFRIIIERPTNALTNREPLE
jgi:hypothetical protein